MQVSLFTGLDVMQSQEQIELGDGVVLTYYAAAFSSHADGWLSTLRKKTPWQQPLIRVAGKRHPIPGLQAWYGKTSRTYSYSGMEFESLPFSPTLLTIKSLVESIDSNTYNSALINCYRNGRDSVAWHADDEPEIDQSAAIGSVSLGASRVFRIKRKHPVGGGKPIKLLLNHGDLLVMPANMQQLWLHEIPKTIRATGERINITFRQLKD